MGPEVGKSEPVYDETNESTAPENPCAAFQAAVSEYLVRHKSVFDVISKLQESDARVNRAVAKAITSCGCVEVNAGRQEIPADSSFLQMKDHMSTHLRGRLCEQCHEVLETEVGRHLFYLVALCDLFGLNLDQVVSGEHKRVTALGMYNLT